ncbi:MAG: single-stranded DNA-binding protein [Gemmatimonadota bacterium]
MKYSRGAKHTDPPEIVEEGDGSFRYVTLAVFRGDGRRREEYAMPSAAVNGASAGGAVR